MPPYSLILKVFALVLFVIAGAWNPPTATSPWFGRLVACGLAFWVASTMFVK